jgi:excisionase family DNA binding protein
MNSPQDTATPPTGHKQDTTKIGVPVADAAVRLGITHDAVRKKLQRGTLPGEKVGSEWRVFLPAQDAQQDNRQDATEMCQDADRTVVLPSDDLVDQLRSEVSFLREQLEQRSREAEQRSRELSTERERFDVIHREALHRIEALTATSTPEPEPRTMSVDASPDAPGATEPGSMSPSTLHPRSRISDLICRMLGRS